MVNPTRRATLEDVASHWWVNWGYTTRVGEQGALNEGGHPSSDPGRTSVAQWLWRSSRPLLENGAKVCSFLKQQAPGGRALAPGLERQHSLKKSRKENAMAQTFQGAPATLTRARGGVPLEGLGCVVLTLGLLKQRLVLQPLGHRGLARVSAGCPPLCGYNVACALSIVGPQRAGKSTVSVPSSCKELVCV